MNDYQIVQDVGRSKFSLVYKGRKKKTVMFYALKCVDKSQKRKIMHEVKFLREFTSFTRPVVHKFAAATLRHSSEMFKCLSRGGPAAIDSKWGGVLTNLPARRSPPQPLRCAISRVVRNGEPP